jgi:voltage-gated potassium channel
LSQPAQTPSFFDRLRSLSIHLVGHVYFELGICTLIIISLVIFGQEQAAAKGTPERRQLEVATMSLNALFLVELSLRRMASGSWRQFFRDCWLDIFAILPGFNTLKLTSTMRLLRLLRLVRVLKFLSQRQALRETGRITRLAESALLIGLLGCAVFVGTFGLVGYEHDFALRAPWIFEAFWRSIFSFFSVQYVEEFPKTVGGKLVALAVIVSGSAFFALVTGMTTAIVAEKIKEGEKRFSMMLLEEMSGHYIFCGWNASSLATIRQIQSRPLDCQPEVIVICEHEHLEGQESLAYPNKVRLLREDFTRISVLRKARVEKAAVAVFFNDTYGGRSSQDADARTVLGALTIEKLCPEVHTCAELSNIESEPHLRMGKVDEIVVSGELCGALLAQAAMDVVGARILQNLMNPNVGCNLNVVRPADELIGQRFQDVLSLHHHSTGSIPIAVLPLGSKAQVNKADYVLKEGDMLYCLVGEAEL